MTATWCRTSGHRGRRGVLLALAMSALALQATGCTELASLPADVRLACSREYTDCPEGFYCNIERWECRRLACAERCVNDERCVDGECVPWGGCEESLDTGCPGCACEACVCADFPACCTGTWDRHCAHRCATCGSCGVAASAVRCQGTACPDLEWVPFPTGEYQMGSDEWDPDGFSQPAHEVTVSAFEMARTEVTVAQYRRCVEAGGCLVPDETYCADWDPGDRDDHPLACLSWYEAWGFSRWVGGRLPSEAEFEYAARSGGQDRQYPWGDTFPDCDLAVMMGEDWGCGERSVWPVCSKPAGNSEQGLCDLAGNAQEWTADDWHEDYTGAPDDGSAWVDSPRAAERVIRDFGLIADGLELRAWVRGGGRPYAPGQIGIGARPVRDAESAAP